MSVFAVRIFEQAEYSACPNILTVRIFGQAMTQQSTPMGNWVLRWEAEEEEGRVVRVRVGCCMGWVQWWFSGPAFWLGGEDFGYFWLCLCEGE